MIQMSAQSVQSFLYICSCNGSILQAVKPIQAEYKLKEGEPIFETLLPQLKDNWPSVTACRQDVEEGNQWHGSVVKVLGEDYICFVTPLDQNLVIVLGMKEKVQQYLYEELLKINGQLTNTIRNLYKEKQMNEAGAYDEISKVNNELVNARRELEKKNLELAALNFKLEELSIRDPMTGLFNRRYFYAKIPEVINRAHRYEKPYCLMAIDINGFKSVNDNFGHDVGDQVLIFLGQCLNLTFRQGQDIVFRLGGDEFLIILEGTDYSEAVLTLERLRAFYGENARETSLAAGILELPFDTSEEGFSEYLKKADELMYQNKSEMKRKSL